MGGLTPSPVGNRAPGGKRRRDWETRFRVKCTVEETNYHIFYAIPLQGEKTRLRGERRRNGGIDSLPGRKPGTRKKTAERFSESPEPPRCPGPARTGSETWTGPTITYYTPPPRVERRRDWEARFRVKCTVEETNYHIFYVMPPQDEKTRLRGERRRNGVD